MRQVIKGDGTDGTAAAKAYLLAHDSLMTQELYEFAAPSISFPSATGSSGGGYTFTPFPGVTQLSPTEDFIPAAGGSATASDLTSNPYFATAPLPWGSVGGAGNSITFTRWTSRTLWGFHQPYIVNLEGGFFYGAPGADSPSARSRSDIKKVYLVGNASGTGLIGGVDYSLNGGTSYSGLVGAPTTPGVTNTAKIDITGSLGSLATFDFTQLVFRAENGSSLFATYTPPITCSFWGIGLVIEYQTPGGGGVGGGVGNPLPNLCDASSALTYAGNLYKPAVIKNDGFKSKIGLDVDSLQLSWTLRGDEALIVDPVTGATILTVLQGFQYGLLEGHWVRWRRVIMPSFGDCDSIGAASMFRGKIAEIELDRLTVKITVNSVTELFNRQVPQQLIEANNRSMQVGPGLPPDLDPDQTHWVKMSCVTGLGGSTTRIVAQQTAPTAGVVYAPGTFDMGYLWLQDPPFANVVAQVRHYEVSSGYNVFELFRPLYVDPHVYAASFTAFVPIPKDQDVSGSSLVELKGFPWVPLPEQAV
jgi:hypothetical protein